MSGLSLRLLAPCLAALLSFSANAGVSGPFGTGEPVFAGKSLPGPDGQQPSASALPALPSGVLPPTSLPGLKAGPTSDPRGLPPLPPLELPGGVVVPQTPSAKYPSLELVVTGSGGYAIFHGVKVSVGGKVPGSKLTLKELRSGSALLSDGTTLRMGDQVPTGR